MSDFKFAEILKGLLGEYKVSGADLGRTIGVSKETVSQYCKGNIIPRADKILKMADFFDVSPEYLLTGQNAEPRIKSKDLKLSGSVLYYLTHCEEEELEFIDKLLNHERFPIIVSLAVMNIKSGAVNVEDVLDRAMHELLLASSPESIRVLDGLILKSLRKE